jgi:hypothetical protein
MTTTAFVRSPLSRTFFYCLTNAHPAGYLILIVLALVVRVVVAPGLAVLLLAVLYSSIWVPQIVRAARRGRPCTLGRKYVIGTTVGRMLLATCKCALLSLCMGLDLRLTYAADFLGCPKNVLEAEPRRMSSRDVD